MIFIRPLLGVALLAAFLAPMPLVAQDTRTRAEAAQERRELTRVLNRLEQQLSALQNQNFELEARVRNLEMLENSPRGVRWRLVREERNPVHAEQMARIEQLEQQLAQARKRYTDDWPGLRELRQSINTERAGLVSIPEFIATVVEEVSEWPEGNARPGRRGEWRQRAAELEARERELADRTAAMEGEYAARREHWDRERAAAQADFDARRADLDNRERQVVERQRDLKRFADKVRGLERSQQQLVNGQAELAQARQQLAQQRAAFERTAKERGGRNPRRGGEIAKLQKDLGKIQQENDQLRKVVADHQRQLDKVSRENARLDKALEERTRENRKLHKEREALTRQLEGKSSGEKSGRTHPAGALRRARELDQARRGYEKQIAGLSTRTDQLTAQIAQLQRRGDVAGANKLRAELSGVMAQLAKARKALEDLPKR